MIQTILFGAAALPSRARVPGHYYLLRGGAWLALASLVLLWSSASAQVQLQIGQNFTGSTLDIDSQLVPPDPNGAVGPAHFVELINGRFSVYSKSNGQRVKTMTDLAFWTQAGIKLTSGWETTDPRIVYDPSVQRWFASQIDFDPSGAVNVNHFLLAVAATADPIGSWHAISIPSDPGGNSGADFPTLGVDSEGVYLSGDMFDPNENPVGPTLVSIPKAGLLTGAPTTNGYTWFGVLSYNDRGVILQPAISVDGSGNGTVLAAGGVGVDDFGNFITNDTLISFRIQNPAGPGPASLTSPSTISVPGYTAPFNPTQPSPNADLDDGDSRFSALVYEVQGVLYAIHGTEIDNRAALRWYRIDATNHTVLESGTITHPVLDLFYGSIAANANGTVVIACNGCSAHSFISAYALVGRTVKGVTSFGSLSRLKAGAAAYSDGGGTSRWGDYSTTSVDPADPTHFWTIQMYPSSSSRWSTQITELITSIVLPSLSITRSGADPVLSWSASATGFVLESTVSLSAPSWTPVTQSPSIVNGQTVVQIPATQPTAFYRLHLP